MGLVSLLFSFNGRINRAQYWAGTLGVSGVNFLAGMMIAMQSGVSAAAKADPAAALGASLGSLGFITVINALAAWCGLALQVKRFHDRGRTGWITAAPMILAIWMIVAVLGVVFSNAPLEQALHAIGLPFGLLMLTSLAFFIDLGCLPGKAEPNKYGNPPGSPPSPSAAPFRPQPSASVSVTNSLFGAQAAMERAIAEQPKASLRPAMASSPRPAPTPTPSPAGGAPSFGRRVTR